MKYQRCSAGSPFNCLILLLGRTLSIKFLLLISFVIFIVWNIKSIEERYQRFYGVNLMEEAVHNVARDVEASSKLSDNLKYILLWTPDNYAIFYLLGKGQRAFLQNNCSATNCFVTDDRNFFGGDVTKFHAVAFHGPNVKYMSHERLPEKRSLHQKYIYFSMESASNYPICSRIFDDYFNWTATYKLNSDIPYPYILIRNENGDIIGPKQHMSWENDDFESEENSFKLFNKSKAAAWFVSSCKSRSGRTQFVEKLQKALLPYSYNVDVYGRCGTLQCPREREVECDNMLEKDYYFYLSLENSFNEDYVTEKLLRALQNNVVPIVYGGADYSRFLPPGSYLDARQMSVQDLAATMARLISSPKMYQQYFKWKHRYSYSDPVKENMCAVCATLNNDTLRHTTSMYKEFRKWWNPNYKEQCRVFG